MIICYLVGIKIFVGEDGCRISLEFYVLLYVVVIYFGYVLFFIVFNGFLFDDGC